VPNNERSYLYSVVASACKENTGYPTPDNLIASQSFCRRPPSRELKFRSNNRQASMKSECGRMATNIGFYLSGVIAVAIVFGCRFLLAPSSAATAYGLPAGAEPHSRGVSLRQRYFHRVGTVRRHAYSFRIGTRPWLVHANSQRHPSFWHRDRTAPRWEPNRRVRPLYILLPICIPYALFLVWQGIPH
jgi:hypothetical protein